MRRASTRRRLPIIGSVAASYRLLWTNKLHWLRAAPFWMLLTWIGISALWYVEFKYGLFRPGTGTTSHMLCVYALQVLGFAPFAVRWFEHELAPQVQDGTNRLPRILRFGGAMFVINGALILPFATMLAWNHFVKDPNQPMQIVLLLCLVVACAVIAWRSFLALPIVALGHCSALVTSWQSMRGSTLRFLLVTALVMLPVVLFDVLLSRAYNAAIDSNFEWIRVSPYLRAAGEVVTWWITSTAAIATTIVAYRHSLSSSVAKIGDAGA